MVHLIDTSTLRFSLTLPCAYCTHIRVKLLKSFQLVLMIEFEYLCWNSSTPFTPKRISIAVGLWCGRNWSEISNSLASGLDFYKTMMSNDNFTALDLASKTLAKKKHMKQYWHIQSFALARTHAQPENRPHMLCRPWLWNVDMFIQRTTK